MMKKILPLLCSALLMLSCNTQKSADSGSESASDHSFSLTELWRTDTLLSTCESVLYSKSNNVLFVSCINGVPSEKTDWDLFPHSILMEP